MTNSRRFLTTNSVWQRAPLFTSICLVLCFVLCLVNSACTSTRVSSKRTRTKKPVASQDDSQLESQLDSQLETKGLSQTSKKSKASKKKRYKVALVITQSSAVFQKPDFDAKILGYIRGGITIPVSTISFPKGKKLKDVPQFYRTKVNGKYGYVADVDLRIATPADLKGATDAKALHTSDARRKAEAREAALIANQQPFVFNRFIGLAAGAMMYREKISGVSASQTLPVYGLKVTGPDVLVRGPIVDFNLLFHYGAPSYYDHYSRVKPRGFMVWTDALLIAPFKQWENAHLYAGIGPLISFSNFQLITPQKAMSLTSFHAGVSLSLGAAFRLQKAAFRVEGKYVFEKTSYPIATLAYQREF